MDDVRRQKTGRLKYADYEEKFSRSLYWFVKSESNLTEKPRFKLTELLQYDSMFVRTYLLKESFQALWHYCSPNWADWFLQKWSAQAMPSKLEPIRKFVKTLKQHQPLIMNWFKAKKPFSSGIVESLNRKSFLVTRKSYDFRSDDVLKIALFHTMGDLLEPELTHSFRCRLDFPKNIIRKRGPSHA